MNSGFGPFLVITTGIVLGVLLRRWKILPPTSPRILNAYVITVALPAVVLSQLPRFLHTLSQSDQMGLSLFVLPLVPWAIFVLAILFFGTLHRFEKITRGEYGLLVLSAGLGNTAFVGFPLIEALLGREALPKAILLDQIGSFLALSVAGTAWLSYLKNSDGSFKPKRFVADVFRFPPFIALILSFIYARFGVFENEGPGTAAFHSMLERFALTLVPVAMVSVGCQIDLKLPEIRRAAKGLTLGLGFKMLLAPVAIWALVAVPFRENHGDLKIAVLEAAMAPMITSTVLGIEAGFAPELGGLMLGIGIPFSLLTVPLWNLILG